MKQQTFGSDPLAVRETDHYKVEYVQQFVEKWDELIDWDARAASEGDFFIRELKKRGAKRILDVATGTGFHSVRLLQEGFNVISVDGSPEMLAKAFENGRRNGHILRTVQADWRWLNRDIHGKFDAVICLGNSFTHLFNEHDRRKALAEFYSALNHDGILILDQRNYDSILDEGFSSKHTYYYCGDNVRAEPEHVDSGLARFRYEFPDESVYYLNMFPLRKRYVIRLMKEVGFQRVTSYGDFKQTYQEDDDPDFFVHVAEKKYIEMETRKASLNYSESAGVAREYYNSSPADRFYATIWGGEDIHIGLYEGESDSIFEASRRTVEKMIDQVPGLSRESRILDLGAGYGGAARQLAERFECQVTCLNLSEVQNTRNRELNESQGLAHLIDVVDGSFEDLSFDDNSFDVVWSQDSFLHSGDRGQVISEASRVLKNGGYFIFTDPMQKAGVSRRELLPVLQRLDLDSMGSFDFYRDIAARNGLKEVKILDLSDQLPVHYGRVRAEIIRRYEELLKVCGEEYLEKMKTGLQHWVDAGEAGRLNWGILVFRL